MSPRTVKALVDRGHQVKKKLLALADELKDINAQLQAVALEGEQIPLQDEDREGKQYIARGSSVTVPVVITADALVQSFSKDSREHLRIADKAGDKLDQFYTLKPKYEICDENGKRFRLLAASILGDDAPAFITACKAVDKNGVPKNKIVVEWDRAEELNPAEAS